MKIKTIATFAFAFAIMVLNSEFCWADAPVKGLNLKIIRNYLGKYQGRWPSDLNGLSYGHDFHISLDSVNESGIFAGTVTMTYQIDGGHPMKNYMTVLNDRITDKVDGRLTLNDSLEVLFLPNGELIAVLTVGFSNGSREQISTLLKRS